MDFELGGETVDRVRQAADLAEVVGEHVRLRRRGRTYEGLCPFHDEKTPSFSVDPDKGLYYCFGCHRGGDVFRFVMETERLSFPEAVAKLAQRFGVHLEPRSPEARRRRDEKDRIRGLLEEAQRFFREELAGAGGASARRELERRGFDGGTWAEFGFGWAADEWRRLTDHLLRSHPQGALITAGLSVQPESGKSPYDRFRKRITFPIQGADGSLVGFGGRILGDGEPKYLNSPESTLFHKRSTLFSLHRARAEIRSLRAVVVVEGYFDCLSLHRAGVGHAVATLGTALTPDHARVLRRELGAAEHGSEPKAILCYDGDAAGRRAATTGIRVLLEAGVAVAIVELPPGRDPDDIVREGGPDAMASLLEGAIGPIPFLLSDLPEGPAQRQRAGAELAELVGAAADPHTRNELLMELSLRLGFSQEVLRDLARHAGPAPGRGVMRTAPPAIPSGESMLVRIVLEGGRSWRRVIAEQLEPVLRSDPRVVRLLEMVRDCHGGPEPPPEDFSRWLLQHTADQELVELLARVTTSEAPPLTDDTIKKHLRLTLHEQWRRQAHALTTAIQEAERAGDDDRVATLQNDLRALRSRRAEI